MSSNNDNPTPYQDVANELTGLWKNELNSSMIINAQDDGAITGYYITQVGNVDPVKFLLVGTFAPITTNNPGDRPGEATLGFVVNWNMPKKDKPQSVTAWSAQLIYDDNDQLKIDASWMLKRKSTWDQKWGSATTNVDTFHKVVEHE